VVTNRIPLAKPPRHQLRPAEKGSLLYGESTDFHAFPSEEARRAAWFEHRDELLLSMGPGRRPCAFWEYDPEAPRYPRHGCQARVLYERGLLTEAEVAELEAKWRQGFEAAWRPGFSICTGQIEGRAHWLEGAQARDAHYRWLGIPRPLLRHLKSARRRRKLEVASQPEPA
jgi:hypothetical protein